MTRTTVNHRKTAYILLVILFTLATLSACTSRNPNYLEQSLQLAGKNRGELEKVLDHYKDNPQKLAAAHFLIENMPYHYYFAGKGMEDYDSIYARMAIEPKQLRDSIFREMMMDIHFEEKIPRWDIEALDAEQLIKAVEDACMTWQQASWSKNYDTHIFFDYVLPYRLFNEQPSNWHTAINEEYPYLASKTVWSNKGMQMEAEKATLSHARVMTFGNAFYRKVAMIDRPLATVTFNVHSPLTARKNLYMRYAATGIDRYVTVSVNGEKISRLHLHPTKSMTVFRLNRTELEIGLEKGDNLISIQYDNGPVALDCIQLASVEPYDESEEEDFSTHYCRISNVGTGNSISLESARMTQTDTIRLRPFSTKTDNRFHLRFDYRGYACWSISAVNSDSANLCISTDNRLIKEDAPVLLADYQNGVHQKWVLIPVGEDLYRIMCKESGLFLKSITDKHGVERLVQATYTGEDVQKWKIERMERNPHNHSSYDRGSALAHACKITDVMHQFEWFEFLGEFMPKASSLCKYRTGICRDEAGYTVFLCRYMGIPATVDFTPHWGNRSRGHEWCVLIKPDGTSVPFYMGRAPGDTIHEYHNYAKPKVFRHRFQLNRSIIEDMKEEVEVPDLFRMPNFTDVTHEYMNTTDITRKIPEKYSTERVAYICVFDNRRWVPVHYGNIQNGEVTFRSMGRDIVYMTALYKDGRIIPFGEAFHIKKDGTIHDLRADKKVKQEMRLLRKHPFLRINDKINTWMSGGRFQGANNADFSDAVDLHVHHGITTGNWYDIQTNHSERFKYLRYIGPNGAYCNINEMVFFDLHGNPITGKIIGKEGEKDMGREKVFDHDILTTFQGLNRSGDWVGLKLYSPTPVGRVRYIGRNDGNCIEFGDEYELYYWENNIWQSLGRHTAQGDTLLYKDVPTGGLYLLHNHTKGKEERIFTYENGMQIWR